MTQVKISGLPVATTVATTDLVPIVSVGTMETQQATVDQIIVNAAPVTGSYLTLGTNDTLQNERVFTPGTGLKAVDGGAGSTYTVEIDDNVVLTTTGSVSPSIPIVIPYNGGLSVPVITTLDSGATPRNWITYGAGDTWTIGNTAQQLHLIGYGVSVDMVSTFDVTTVGGILTFTNLAALAAGSLVSAAGYYSVALGYASIASAELATAIGYNATASRFGEYAHSSQGNNGVEGLHAIDLYADLNATPGNLVDPSAIEITLEDSKSYSMRVRILASKVGAQATAHEVRELLLHATGGAIAIDNDTLISNPLVAMGSQGWTATISAPGALVFRINCDPGADHVKFMARIEWSALPGA